MILFFGLLTLAGILMTIVILVWVCIGVFALVMVVVQAIYTAIRRKKDPLYSPPARKRVRFVPWKKNKVDEYPPGW